MARLRSGLRVLVDSCPTWSLAPIDHRACQTHPELQDQLERLSSLRVTGLVRVSGRLSVVEASRLVVLTDPPSASYDELLA